MGLKDRYIYELCLCQQNVKYWKIWLHYGKTSLIQGIFYKIRICIICSFIEVPYAFRLNICSEAFFAGNQEAAKAIMSAVKATRIKSVITNLTGK